MDPIQSPQTTIPSVPAESGTQVQSGQSSPAQKQQPVIQTPPTSQPPKQNPAPQIPQINTSNPIVTAATQGQGANVDQLRRLGDKIEKAVLPQELKQNLIERIQRLALLRQSTGYMGSNFIVEYETTAQYVNWVVSLPWNTFTQDTLDIHKAAAILEKNHYGLAEVKGRILDYLAALILNLRAKDSDHVLRAPILCLVGLAGTGKTTLAISIAEALGRKFERIPFGGMGDARVLRGQSRLSPDAEPGVIVKKLVHAASKNSVILLDELDRVSDAARADIMGVLIELLDPGQNNAFSDHYIDYPFDLSKVLFIATANNTTNIATAVMDRLEVIQMPSYSDQEKNVIAKSYLYPKERKASGLSETQLVVDEDVWVGIIRPLGFDSGIRSLDRTIGGMCRKAARLIVEGQAQQVHITSQNVKQFLPLF